MSFLKQNLAYWKLIYITQYTEFLHKGELCHEEQYVSYQMTFLLIVQPHDFALQKPKVLHMHDLQWASEKSLELTDCSDRGLYVCV